MEGSGAPEEGTRSPDNPNSTQPRPHDGMRAIVTDGAVAAVTAVGVSRPPLPNRMSRITNQLPLVSPPTHRFLLISASASPRLALLFPSPLLPLLRSPTSPLSLVHHLRSCCNPPPTLLTSLSHQIIAVPLGVGFNIRFPPRWPGLYQHHEDCSFFAHIFNCRSRPFYEFGSGYDKKGSWWSPTEEI